MNGSSSVWALGWYFAGLSLMAIGGANSVIPDMHRHFVEITGLLNETEFVQLVALAQAAPGPNILVVSLIGWRVAGLPGALIAFLGMCLPSSLLAFGVANLLRRFKGNRWVALLHRSLAPITVGLILAGGFVLTRAADHQWSAYAITGATVIAVLNSKLNPLWLLSLAGLAGFLIER